MIVIARLTIRELIRRRVVWVLAALTVLSVLLVSFGLDRLVALARDEGTNEIEIRIGVSQVLILIAFMFSFVLAMTAAFVGAPAVGGDLEIGRRARAAGPSHPASRPGAREVARFRRRRRVVRDRVRAARHRGRYGHLRVRAARPLLAVAFLAAEALVLLTLTLALGSVMPSIAAGAIAVVGFGLGWMAGVLVGVASALGVDALRSVAEVSRLLLPTDGLWRGVIYGLEPPAVVMIATGRAGALADANPFYATEPPSVPFMIWSVVWMVLVLGAATWWFERRDL
ncbi:MAG: hypothetical protein WKF78_15760 [Candidatus Limnocylindrales bacterium]